VEESIDGRKLLALCIANDGHGGIVKDSISIEVRDFSKYVKGNLLAHYPFNNNANDLSGNNRNGIISNMVSVVDRNGNPSSAYSFDGVRVQSGFK